MVVIIADTSTGEIMNEWAVANRCEGPDAAYRYPTRHEVRGSDGRRPFSPLSLMKHSQQQTSGSSSSSSFYSAALPYVHCGTYSVRALIVAPAGFGGGWPCSGRQRVLLRRAVRAVRPRRAGHPLRLRWWPHLAVLLRDRRASAVRRGHLGLLLGQPAGVDNEL